MKKALLLLSLVVYFLGGVQAQEKEYLKDSLLISVLQKLESNTYTVAACCITADYSTKTPFIKKGRIELDETNYLVLSSDPFADEKMVICRSIRICNKKTGHLRIITFEKEGIEKLDRILGTAKAVKLPLVAQASED